jgi:glucosylglycerate phosphorylase
VWTTFSADQIDINYRNLDTLLKMIDILLFYVTQGASLLRLDAVGFLWKEIGTRCMHLPQTHDMIKLFRALLDQVAPDVVLITETNVPQDENVSYFGDEGDEAQMVYNFPLPPLLLHTFVKEDATALSRWAKGLSLACDNTTFFNFTASHDGIGLRPLEGILPQEDIDALVDRVRACGGEISFRKGSDGSEVPYELNISYVDAILGTDVPHKTEKFLASQAIQFALPGVPATYIHSLLGSRNWTAGVEKTGHPRSINREKLNLDDVVSQLNDPESFRSKIFFPYVHLIKTRRQQAAFHPNASFEVLDMAPGLFAVKRETDDQTIYALTNISSRQISASLSQVETTPEMVDLLTGQRFKNGAVVLEPYTYVWLTTDAVSDA